LNFKADLSGGDPLTAMVTGDHDSRLTDHTNVIVTRDEMADGTVRRSARRLTPVEGERLQGIADGFTRPCFTAEQIADDGLVDMFTRIHLKWAQSNGKMHAKPKSRMAIRTWMARISSERCPEKPRYKVIGNAMPVNVMQWIGMRIDGAC